MKQRAKHNDLHLGRLAMHARPVEMRLLTFASGPCGCMPATTAIRLQGKQDDRRDGIILTELKVQLRRKTWRS